MNELAARNMALLCDALDKENCIYFRSDEHLTSYMACSDRYKSAKLMPNVIRLTITPQDTGILFEAHLPMPLKVKSDEGLHSALLRIAQDNYSTMRGALAYRPASGLLYYRLFYALTESASEFSAKEALFCLKLCATSLNDSYPFIVRILDSCRPCGDADGSKASSDPVQSDLHGLFSRLFGHSDVDVPSLAEDLIGDEEDDSDAAEEDSDTPENAALRAAFPDDSDDEEPEDDEESSSLNEELLSILDDILESDDPAD